MLTAIWHAIRWTFRDPDGYNVVSGPLPDVTLLGGIWLLLKRHNCHVRGCWRMQWKHTAAGDVVCKKHHPDEQKSHERIVADHLEAKRVGQG